MGNVGMVEGGERLRFTLEEPGARGMQLSYSTEAVAVAEFRNAYDGAEGLRCLKWQ